MRFIFPLLFCVSVYGQSDPWKNVYIEGAWKERDAWQKPEELIRQLALSDGSTVADIGSHEGYLTFKLSKAVGEGGKVFAVDVDQNKLDKLKEHARDRLAKNIQTVKGDYDDPKLPVNALDAVIILDTYHEMDDHDEMLQHIKRALKKGGRLVLCEPIAEARRDQPRAVQEGKHELGMNYAIEDLLKAGFHIITKKDRFVDRENIKGDMMWLLVAVKS